MTEIYTGVSLFQHFHYAVSWSDFQTVFEIVNISVPEDRGLHFADHYCRSIGSKSRVDKKLKIKERTFGPPGKFARTLWPIFRFLDFLSLIFSFLKVLKIGCWSSEVLGPTLGRPKNENAQNRSLIIRGLKFRSSVFLSLILKIGRNLWCLFEVESLSDVWD